MLAEQLEAAAELIRESRDLLEERPTAYRSPAAVETRGWTDWLLALSDDALAELETLGPLAPRPPSMPPSLAGFLDQVRAVTMIQSLRAEAALPQTRRPHETPRKSLQIQAFAAELLPLARAATRVVDVGSGHGHLTRAIAAAVEVPVLGLERDPRLAERAQALAGDAAAFLVTDVLEQGLRLSPGDCAIGLHACGALGDEMVEATAAEPKAAMALVGCCLQKRRAELRRPLSQGLAGDPALALPRGLLGLSNLSASDQGVEQRRSANLEGRERRLALHHLLEARLGALRFGEEIAGQNRRAAGRPLMTLVEAAFASRQLPLPSAAEVEAAQRWAAELHPRLRRLAIPRGLLGRVLEVFVLLDRGRRLEEVGRRVRFGTLFPQEISARNLLLLSPAER